MSAPNSNVQTPPVEGKKEVGLEEKKEVELEEKKDLTTFKIDLLKRVDSEITADKFAKDGTINKIIEKIRTRFKAVHGEENALSKKLEALIKSDNELMKIFVEIINNDDYKDVIDDVVGLTQELFKLQVKIIFDTCYQIFEKTSSDGDTVKLVKELFKAFRAKLSAMNEFFEVHRARCVPPSQNL